MTQEELFEIMTYNEGALYWRPSSSGVAWHKQNRKWIAQIGVEHKNIYLGSFLTQQEAHKAYVDAYYERYPFGKMAGTVNGNGYRQVRIQGKIYPEHRLIFLYHYGFLPLTVDHIDGNRLNNRIENLRAANMTQQSYNAIGKGASIKGVTFHKQDKKWQAQLSVDGKNKYLGQYATKEEAAAVVAVARDAFHGDFACHQVRRNNDDTTNTTNTTNT